MSCPQIWNIEPEKDKKKKEKKRQASETQREKGRQRSRARDKKQRRLFLLEKQHENFVAAVTKFEMLSDTNTRRKCAAAKKVNKNAYEILSIKKGFWKFPVEFMQNNCKEMYKKVCCTCKSSLLLIRPLVVFHRSPVLPSPLSNYTILYFV